MRGTSKASMGTWRGQAQLKRMPTPQGQPLWHQQRKPTLSDLLICQEKPQIYIIM